MPRLSIILLLSCAYVGCAARPSGPGPDAPLHPTGPPDVVRSEVRVLVGTGLDRDEVARELVAEPLVPGRLARRVIEPGEAAPSAGLVPPGCVGLEIDASHTLPDGAAVRSGDLIAAWEEGLDTPGSDHGWLLGPVEGVGARLRGEREAVAGLRRGDGVVTICTSRHTPDLPDRLAFPALWYWREDEETGAREGPGPYVLRGDGSLAARRGSGADEPGIERVTLVPDEGRPALMLRLGEAELGVVAGRDAFDLLARPEPGLHLLRAESLDRVYFLWLSPRGRWINDPRFRAWIAGTVDRGAMLRYLFGGRGSPAWRLLGDEPRGAAWDSPERRPLARGSRARLELHLDRKDPYAGEMARRLAAELEQHSVAVVPLPVSREELQRALSHDEPVAALLFHRPGGRDPLLGLTETLWRLPHESVRDALREAQLAASLADGHARLEAAARAEDAVLADARVVPLLRLHAWLAVRHGLRFEQPEQGSPLLLRGMRWTP